MGSLTDFNDLHVSQGLDEVRRQLFGALNSLPDDSPAPPDYDMPPWDGTPPAPSECVVPMEVERITLDQALERFALVFGDTRVWDARTQTIIKRLAFQALVGKEVAGQWLEHAKRRTVNEQDVTAVVARAQAAAPKEGGGGLFGALRRYVYIYPSTDVWDRDDRARVPMTGLKYAIADCFDDWLKHPHRAQIAADKLVFDPRQENDPATHINTFRGLPLKPVRNMDACRGIRYLITHLCNNDRDTFTWLVNWLAYPLQHVGEKMATSVLMHSETHGSGKSLLFDEIMRRIYGDYGTTLGQHQLESQYTDWRSQKLYCLFEELLGRDQRFSQTGTIKHMITGKTHRVEQKFVTGWEEPNFANMVFLSNEVQPFPVETSDRRFMVIWPETALPKEALDDVKKELDNGGVEAFYGWLLSLDLSGFDGHTKPPMNEAKERLIDFGRQGWDVFYREWESETLQVADVPIPYCSCRTEDLFRVYERWASSRRESIISHTKFAGLVSNRVTRRKDVRYKVGLSDKKGTVFQVGRESGSQSQAEYLGEQIAIFQKAMQEAMP